MVRVRFEVPFHKYGQDYRPRIWLLKWPYWVCGTTPYAFILVAYANDVEQIEKQWPHSTILKVDEKEKIEFTVRFYRPRWYRNTNLQVERNGDELTVIKPPPRLTKESLKNGIDIDF